LSGSRACFADAQAHPHDTEDTVAFFEIAGRIEVARTRQIDIDDFLDGRGTPLAYRAAAAYLAFVFYRSVAGEMQKLEDVATKPKEILVATVARPFQGNRNSLFDSSRALGHDDNAIAHINCFVDVVSDEEHGRAPGLPKTKHFILHAHTRKGIERAEGLIEKQRFRMIDKRACQSNALRHPAGKMVWIGVGKTLQTDEPHEFIYLMSLFVQNMPGDETRLDVPSNSKPRKQAWVLKDQSTFRARALNWFRADENFAGIR